MTDYFRQLVRYLQAFNRRLTVEDAEDLAQDTLLQVYVKEPDAGYPYVRQRAKWNALNDVTRGHRDEPLGDLQPASKAPAAESQMLARQETASFTRRYAEILATFPPLTQQAFTLHLRGMADKQIAQLLDLTHDAVRTRLKHVRRRMREGFGEVPRHINWNELELGDDDAHEE